MKKLLVAAASGLFAGFLSLFSQPGAARADEIAPELEIQELRQIAEMETKQLVAALDPAAKKRLVGIYVAHDPSMVDPTAMASCDDDGDYVILISDALLRLASHVARAQSYDEESGQHTVDEYASFMARSQVRGRRILPPPPGSLSSEASGQTRADRLHEAISFVMARELAHLRAGDLVCANPTATKEHGDEEWTAAESAWANAAAARLYPGRAQDRDEEATIRTTEIGHGLDGALGLLGFFGKLEAERAAARDQARFIPSYVALHPNAASRIASVKKVQAAMAKDPEPKAKTMKDDSFGNDDSPAGAERAAMAKGARPTKPTRKQ